MQKSFRGRAHGGLAAIAITAALCMAAGARAQVIINSNAGEYSLSVISWRDIPFRTVVRQQYDYSCGSAALATLLRFHYGLDVGESQIFRSMYEHGDQAKIRKVGFSLLDMKQYLARQGMAADGYRGGPSLLEATTTPAIAVVSIGPYKHFVVIKGVRPGQVLVGDPALGLKIYSEKDFLKMWGGILFWIHDGARRTAVFNNPKDWQPWAVAPVTWVAQGRDLGFTAYMPIIFQVVQLKSP
jgi:uncharacterized protein